VAEVASQIRIDDSTTVVEAKAPNRGRGDLLCSVAFVGSYYERTVGVTSFGSSSPSRKAEKTLGRREDDQILVRTRLNERQIQVLRLGEQP
jgi:hypothetical protein